MRSSAAKEITALLTPAAGILEGRSRVTDVGGYQPAGS